MNRSLQICSKVPVVRSSSVDSRTRESSEKSVDCTIVSMLGEFESFWYGQSLAAWL
jgi:hypothetical protein